MRRTWRAEGPDEAHPVAAGEAGPGGTVKVRQRSAQPHPQLLGRNC